MGGRGGYGGTTAAGGGGAINQPIEPRPRITDTTDLRGYVLRSVLLDLDEIQRAEREDLEAEMTYLKTMQKNIEMDMKQTKDDVNYEIGGFKDYYPATEKETEIQREKLRERKYYEMNDEYIKILGKIGEAAEKLDIKKKEHLEKQRELFYVGEGNRIEVKIDISKSTKLYKNYWKDYIKPQKEFIEKTWKQSLHPSEADIRSKILEDIRGRGITKQEIQFLGISTTRQPVKYDVKMKGIKGSGGSYTGYDKLIKIGYDYPTSTTPVHELGHHIEEVTPKAEEIRTKKVKEYLEKKTRKKLHEIELKEWEMIPGYTYPGIYIPKDVLTPEEEHKYGYMFRIYSRHGNIKIDTTSSGENKMTINPSSKDIGTEFPSSSMEYIYSEPATFARTFPEIFDMHVDLMRGHLHADEEKEEKKKRRKP